MIETGAVLKRCIDTRYCNIGGEGVVVRQTAGEVLVLNEIGVRVLELLEATMPVSGLLDALEAEYEIDRPTLERDVLVYLRELVDAGVIEHVAA
jgi:hypothetical protein